MSKQLLKLTYWVMYEERTRRQNETEWRVNKVQHYGTDDLARAQCSVEEIALHAERKTHFWSNAPEGYYILRAWIEAETRYLVPNSARPEPKPTAENSQEA